MTILRVLPRVEGRARDRLGWALSILAIVAATSGVALRVRAITAPRSLWLDEAMLALSICGRTIAGLWGPLEYHQGAPFGFLVLERLAVLAFGPGEWPLRIVPCVASIVAMGLVYRFCGARFGAIEAVVGLALAATLPALIFYAAEAKQYAPDIAVGLMILTASAGPIERGLTVRRGLILAVVGALAVWLSHPSVFFLAGSGSVLIVAEARRGRIGATVGAFAIAATWAASFLASYLLLLRGLRGDDYLASFWAEAFLPFPPRSMADLKRYVALFLGLFETMYQNYQVETGIESRMSVVAAVVWLAGIAALWQGGKRAMLALLVLPLAFGTVAAILQQYPMRVRMVLFAVGPIVPVMAAGIGSALRAPDPARRALGWSLLAGALALPILQAGPALIERPRPYGARFVLAEVAERWKDGDVLLVDGASEPPFRFYQRFGGIAGLGRIEPTRVATELRDPEQLESEIARWAGRGRVWLVLTAHMGDPGGREDRFLRRTLDRLGQRLDSAEARGYLALLYDFQPPERTAAR